MDLDKIGGIMNTEKDQILINHLNCYIFQFDNDHKHTNNVLKAYLIDKHTMEHHQLGTTQSVDFWCHGFNVIEAVWDVLDIEQNKRQP